MKVDLKENIDIINLIKVLGRGIKKHGVQKIIRSLQKIELIHININHLDVIDFIETSICERYKILRTTLYQINTRGDITIARELCVLFLRKHLKMSDEEIGSHYNRTRQTLHNAKNKFDRLNVKSKADAKFINIYNEFDTKIQDYITEIKSKTQTETNE